MGRLTLPRFISYLQRFCFVLCFLSLFNMVSMQGHHEDSALGLLFPFLPEAARAFRVPWPKIPKAHINGHGGGVTVECCL